MSDELTRRDFLQLAASGAGLSGLGGWNLRRALDNIQQPSALQGLPALDGSVVYEHTTLELAATDQGGIVRRLPRAVLQPGSVEDVVRMVRYAHEKRLPVAMRGRGHSAYGQTLVESGIVIDSRTLDKVVSVSGRAIEVEAGASLGTVVRAAFDARSLVPVMSGCSILSVGGWISVGGIGGESFRHGAFVDQVIELHVVTGDGRLIRCSDTHESELFAMVLAGMGQCGIIARAKLRLSPIPEQITSRTITYESLEPFLGDQERFAANDRLDSLWTAIRRSDDGSWRYEVTVGRRGAADEDTDPLTLIGDISRGRAAASVRRMYRDMVPPPSAAPASRRQVAASNGALIGRKGDGNPALCVYLPASAAREIMAPLLSSPSDSAGISTIECVALNANRFHRSLFRLPGEERVFSCWVLRTAYADSGPSLQKQLDANARFLEKALALGAKRYPPFGGMTTPADWRLHYGDRLYRRFAAAKQRYDPRGILTPGAHIFELG